MTVVHYCRVIPELPVHYQGTDDDTESCEITTRGVVFRVRLITITN